MWSEPTKQSRPRGRPFKGPSDVLREGALRQIVAVLPEQPAACGSYIQDVLDGAPPKGKRMERIAEHCPHVREAMRWPLRLLDTRLTDRKTILDLAATYDSSLPAWPFGDRVLELPDPLAHDPVRYRANAYWCLMAREDIYGFLSLLCEFRRAHTTNDVETAFDVARYLARATVGAGLNAALLEKAMLLATTVNELLLTLPYCCVPVEIDLDVYARMISKRTTYKEDVTPDPLVHIRLVRTTASRASLIFPRFDTRLS